MPQDLITPLLDWATAHGPPNWTFVVAILTAPHLWSRYIKKVARDLYAERFGESADG